MSPRTWKIAQSGHTVGGVTKLYQTRVLPFAIIPVCQMERNCEGFGKKKVRVQIWRDLKEVFWEEEKRKNDF